jgi:hypothetical protein
MIENRSSILTSLGINACSETHQVKTVTETEADIVRFAEVPGDFNPVHIFSDFVKKRLLGAELPMWDAGRGIKRRGCR